MYKKILKFTIIFVIIFSWVFGYPPVYENFWRARLWQEPPIPPEIQEALAANYLTNPSFTGGTTGWTLTTTVYDSTYYQDTAGSAKTATAVGRNTAGTGSAEQTISTNIEAGSTVKLSHYWSKQCVAVNCALNTIQVDIAKPSAPTTWVTIWSNTSIPAFGSATAWTGPSNLDVSSNFNETGQYNIRLYADLKNGKNASAQSLAWFDNINLDVTPPNITVGTTGTQTANMNIPSTNNYVGGAFTFVRNAGTADVTQIIITDTGTVNANANLSNVDLYYETAASCVYDATESLFGTALSFNASEKATVSGTMSVGTSQVCVYIVLDVGSGASADQTIEIEISNPSTEVTVSAGTVSPSTVVAITGTTTLQAITLTCTTLPATISFDSVIDNNNVYTVSTWVTTTITSGAGFTLSIQDCGDNTNCTLAANPGLYAATSTPADLIGSATAVFASTAILSAGTEGYGIRAATTTAGTGANLTLSYRYGVTNQSVDPNYVGGLGINDVSLASSTAAVTSKEVSVIIKAAVSASNAKGYYKDILTFTCASSP